MLAVPLNRTYCLWHVIAAMIPAVPLDSPVLTDTLLNEYLCLSKEKVNANQKFRYGGIHGLCILVKPELVENVEVIKDTTSECILWIKVKIGDIFQCIFGAVYVPCENSRFYFNDVFQEIENDMLELKVRYDLPVCILGDFNAHTQLMNDFIDFDHETAELTGCDLLVESRALDALSKCPNFTAHRYNQDTADVNKNGKQLISLCHTFDLSIMNGRLGQDKFLGNPTCRKTRTSVIDYAIANDKMLPFLSDFCVEMFDKCMSDLHCPISCQVHLSQSYTITNSIDSLDEDAPHTRHTGMPLNWSNDIAINFKNCIQGNEIDKLEEFLNEITPHANPNDLNELCEKLNDTLIEAAKKAGVYVDKRKDGGHKPKMPVKKREKKPWFDKDCIHARNMYYKVKNVLKRKGEKSMCNQESKKFKKLLRNKEKMYNKNLRDKIRTLRTNNAKEYWHLLNKSTEGKKVQTKLSLESFLNHFQKLNQKTDHNRIDDLQHGDNLAKNEAINIDFTPEEISLIIRKLKNNKACGLDYLRNEFLKNAPERIIIFTCKLFNLILECKIVPDAWSQGLIMPLYKHKGSRNDPDNYRGITLLSCLGKLFTACLNSRISNYLYSNDLIGNEQAGFRPEFSTLDHIFALHSIIDYYKNKKGRVYCAFVDYSKAFDSIDRISLWMKLLQHGIDGRVFDVIQYMYQHAKSCVIVQDKLSSFFPCNNGVRQGENLSPILFAIYLNDFKDVLSKSYAGLSMLSSDMSKEIETMVNLYTLLYADDTIIMAESADELQKALGALHEHCKKWSLSVNVSKTKIVIFSRGKVTKFPTFYLGQETVEVVPNYTYLGVVFNFNGLFNKAIEKQIAQARKAMFGLLEKAKILKLPIDVTCDLFDKVVLPVLLYGCEIWGWANLKDIEIFFRNFLRTLLKTFKFTPNCMLYGETGTTDVKTKIMCRMTNFWAKLKPIRTDKFSSMLFHLMSNLQCQQPDVFDFKWIKCVQNWLNQNGFSEMWEMQHINTNWFKHIFKLRCNDIFQQNWQEEVMSNSQCSNYRIFKKCHELENYITDLEPMHVVNIGKFRTRTHHLPVTNQRFHDASANINCTLCQNGEVGDECHYLFKCDYFAEERNSLMPPYCKTDPAEECFKAIFRAEKESLTKVARFAKIIMSKFKFSKDRGDNCQTRKKIKITRSGRTIIPPHKLDL